MPTLSCSGVETHYNIHSGPSENGAGSKQSVLLLAGIASDTASWNPVSGALAEHAQIITLDNRCAGQSRPLTAETSRDLMVADVLRVLDACNIEKVTLVGHSMGALISWAVAAKAPERVNGIVAASAPFAVDPARVELFNTLARLRTNANEADWFRLLFHFLFSQAFFENSDALDSAVDASLGYEHKQPLSAFKIQCEALPSYLDIPELPKPLGFPALALTGVNDRLFTPEDLTASYAHHPEIELEVIPDAAHSVHWENPSAFIRSVVNFLNKLTD